MRLDFFILTVVSCCFWITGWRVFYRVFLHVDRKLSIRTTCTEIETKIFVARRTTPAHNSELNATRFSVFPNRTPRVLPTEFSLLRYNHIFFNEKISYFALCEYLHIFGSYELVRCCIWYTRTTEKRKIKLRLEKQLLSKTDFRNGSLLSLTQ